MTNRGLPDQDILNALLRYEPQTGLLFWKPRPLEMFADAKSHHRWNVRFADKEALVSLNAGGYRRGTLLGVNQLAHRVIFKLMTGCDPNQVDHLNGVRTDNRWANLREVTPVENQKNMKMDKRNTSGVPGTDWHKGNKKWRVRIGHKLVGYYSCIDEARLARLQAEKTYGYHENHGRAA